MSIFHEELIAVRKAKKLTQEQLAEMMNTSRPAISHWENGRSEPNIEALIRLSHILEYDFITHTPMKNGQE